VNTDREDITTVLDGRRKIFDEIKSSPDELKTFLSKTFRIFLADQNFLYRCQDNCYPIAQAKHHLEPSADNSP